LRENVPALTLSEALIESFPRRRESSASAIDGLLDLRLRGGAVTI